MAKRLIMTLVLGCALLALGASAALAGKCDRARCCGSDKKGIRPHRMQPQHYQGTREDLRRRDRETYRRMVLMALQGDFDARLRLSCCQKARLRWLGDRYDDECYRLVDQYFSDRRMDVIQLNHRLTALNHHVASWSRHKLTPFQDKVYPDCPWFDYSSECWNEGYHPWAEYVLECLEEDEEPYIWFPR